MRKSLLFLLILLFTFSFVSATFEIKNINIPGKLTTGGNYEVNVTIQSTDTISDVIINTFAKGISVSPTAQNVGLHFGENNIKLNIGTSSEEQIGEITIKVCGMSEFTEASCMNKTTSFIIAKEEINNNSGLYWIIVLLIIVIVGLFIGFKWKKR